MEHREGVIRFLLRVPPELHERLRLLAARERRSLHAQILYLLEQAVGEANEGKVAA
jgi:predicted HicB family RNase H-like nuclease